MTKFRYVGSGDSGAEKRTKGVFCAAFGGGKAAQKWAICAENGD